MPFSLGEATSFLTLRHSEEGKFRRLTSNETVVEVFEF